MREIKFRGWSAYHKEFTYSYTNGMASFFAGIAQHEKHDPIILGQFTGLKDKNGKEIYEGDIVRFHWNPIFNEASTVFEFECPVEYDSGWGCFVMRIHSKKGDEQRIAVGSPHEAGSKGGIEVIGNIYENPELLKSL